MEKRNNKKRKQVKKAMRTKTCFRRVKSDIKRRNKRQRNEIGSKNF